MTRLDRLLLMVPRLRSLVLDRDAYAAHTARLQRELDESLARQTALREELTAAEREAAAHDRALTTERDSLAAHCKRLEGAVVQSRDELRRVAAALQAELEKTEREGAEREHAVQNERDAAMAHLARLQRELDESAGLRRVAARLGADATITDKMRADWDARARTEGTYFIATAREEWTDESFFASGEDTVRRFVLNDMQNICQERDPKQMRVLEIGCGAGRVTRALASVFGEVHAVDVSPEMIRLAGEKLADLGNVHLYTNSGADLAVLPDAPFHFAFSFIVFQHIPEKAIVESYLREAHRVLAPGCLFKLQVEGGRVDDGDPADTWRGVSFTEPELRAMAERCSFELRYTDGAGTQYFWAWLFRRS